MLFYVVKMLHQVASRTGRKKIHIILITKDVSVVQPGNVKASAPRASYYNSERWPQCKLRVESKTDGSTKDCSLS